MSETIFGYKVVGCSQNSLRINILVNVGLDVIQLMYLNQDVYILNFVR